MSILIDSKNKKQQADIVVRYPKIPESATHPANEDDSAETEMQKDIWDVRKFGCRYHTHRCEYTLNFTVIPDAYRPLVKRYMALRVVSKSQIDCRFRLRHLKDFTKYWLSVQPDAATFHELSREDIEVFLRYVKNTPMKGDKPASQNHISRTMMAVKDFLEYLQRTECPEAPETSVARLVWSDDLQAPKRQLAQLAPPKHIPEDVLQQLDHHIDKLYPAVRPVVIVLRASGFRLSDVLNLRYNNCLDKTDNGWWLVGDIQKTQIREHRVPISDEIAMVIASQRDLIQGQLTDKQNPERYIFASTDKRRVGKPITWMAVTKALNEVAAEQGIRDNQGRIYHFNVHAFRHTKGMELLNNGMNILHVQKWLAHVSPEMTLRYARILDTTMRDEWEKTLEKGVLCLSVDGTPKTVTASDLRNNDQIEWDYIRHNLDAVRLPTGYCLKSSKVPCPCQEVPCYTCPHHCTTAEFLPQFKAEREGALRLIAMAEMQGNAKWIESNRRNLERLEPIIQALEERDVYHPAGKAVREYTQGEIARRNGVVQ